MKPHTRFGFVVLSIFTGSLLAEDRFVVGLRTNSLSESVALSDSKGQGEVDTDNALQALLDNVQSLRESHSLIRSEAVGGRRGGPFAEIPGAPAVLVGLNYTASRHYAGHLTIKAVQPIYLGRDGEILGQWHGKPYGKVHQVRARTGFAVAGIVAKWGNRIDGMRLIFMAIKDGRLNPEVTYRSEWIGGLRGSPETLCGLSGNPIVGIYGRQGNDLDSLGFVQANQIYWITKPKTPSLESLMPRLVGNWLVTYTNNTQHTRQIYANQSVNESEEIVQDNDDILIVFPDAIERVTLSGDRLLIEHFNPSSTYPNGTPAVMGVGKRAEQ